MQSLHFFKILELFSGVHIAIAIIEGAHQALSKTSKKDLAAKLHLGKVLLLEILANVQLLVDSVRKRVREEQQLLPTLEARFDSVITNRNFPVLFALLSGGAGGALGAGVFVSGSLALLAAFGFTATGITGGSLGAIFMSSYGGVVAAGSAVSVLQSAGAIGAFGVAATLGIAVVGAVVVGGAVGITVLAIASHIKKKKQQKKTEEQ